LALALLHLVLPLALPLALGRGALQQKLREPPAQPARWAQAAPGLALLRLALHLT
jgi:hypothetical protein